MAKISKDGLITIKMQLKTAMESLADRLEKDGTLNSVSPQLSLIWEIINDIEQNWEKIDD